MQLEKIAETKAVLTASTIHGLISIFKIGGEYWYKFIYFSKDDMPMGPYDSIEECVDNATGFGF